MKITALSRSRSTGSQHGTILKDIEAELKIDDAEAAGDAAPKRRHNQQ
jgi:hypothetical protein